MSLTGLFAAVTDRFERAFAPLGHVVLLVLRLVWGWQFFTTGLGKLQNHERVVAFFTSLGVPAPGLNAWFVGSLEMVGGLLLLLGLFSRPVSLLLTGSMTVAFWTAEKPAFLGVLHDLDAFLRADAFWFLFVSVVVLTLGPGAISLDRLLGRLTAQRAESAAKT